MKIKDTQDLIEHAVQDLYSNESQILEALPEVIKNTESAELKKSLKEHLAVTKEHAKRLKEIAKALDFKHEGEKCKAMEGILKEGEKSIKDASPEVVDLIIASGCDKVEHYEIAGYRFLLLLLQAEDNANLVSMVEQTLQEEEEASMILEGKM